MLTLPAPAKLTLSLRIVGVEPEGYHLIDAEMVSVDLADELVIDDGDDGSGDGFVVDGPAAASVPTGEANLVRQALVMLGLTADIRLTKRIPAGAGLGGGSADAAAVLRWAGCDDLTVAATLGADVPFCLVGGRARVTGVGEVIEPLPFENRVFTLVTPPIAVSTAAVYRAWDELGGPTGGGANDLEPAALVVAPELARWRDDLATATGRAPRLAGSGSTWFVEGDFPGEGRVVVRSVRSAGG